MSLLNIGSTFPKLGELENEYSAQLIIWLDIKYQLYQPMYLLEKNYLIRLNSHFCIGM